MGDQRIMVVIKEKGNFNKTFNYLNKLNNINLLEILNYYGQKGVEALYLATPKDSGKTASSWYYTIEHKNGKYTLSWRNSNERNGESVALLIQYGYVSKTGYRIQSRDYINPAIKPIYDEMIRVIEEGVKKS